MLTLYDLSILNLKPEILSKLAIKLKKEGLLETALSERDLKFFALSDDQLLWQGGIYRETKYIKDVSKVTRLFYIYSIVDSTTEVYDREVKEEQEEYLKRVNEETFLQIISTMRTTHNFPVVKRVLEGTLNIEKLVNVLKGYEKIDNIGFLFADRRILNKYKEELKQIVEKNVNNQLLSRLANIFLEREYKDELFDWLVSISDRTPQDLLIGAPPTGARIRVALRYLVPRYTLDPTFLIDISEEQFTSAVDELVKLKIGYDFFKPIIDRLFKKKRKVIESYYNDQV